MRLFSFRPGANRSLARRGQARTVLLVLVFFILGGCLGAYWYGRHVRRDEPARPADAQPTRLSDATKSVLQHLEAPVTIRFYSLLDPATVPEDWIAFSGRIEQLLSAYVDEANGKIQLTHYDSHSDFNAAATAAAGDGIPSFNIEKGNACYLGIAVSQGQQKDTLPRLAPEWEQALEPDVTRAILRVSSANAAAAPVLTPKADANTVEQVKQALPNWASISLEQGTQTLRDAALARFKEAANEMDRQIKEAQRQLSEAQNGKSEAEQQSAMQRLQQVQAQQADKLKAIAAELQAQINALKQLKAQ